MKPVLAAATACIVIAQLFCSSLAAEKEIWLGTAPFCNLPATTECSDFGMRLIRTDLKGSGSTCITGEKRLCRPPPPLPPLASSPDARKFTVVSYNVYNRPFVISHDGQTERTCRIPYALIRSARSADAIVLQEAFNDGCFHSSFGAGLRWLLKRNGFRYVTSTVGEGVGLAANGGVFIASRWPIVRSGSKVYRNSDISTGDYVSRKGVMYAAVRKLDRLYHIFGTHLQAEFGESRNKIRELQGQELQQFIQLQAIPNDEAVLIAGDLNADLVGQRAHQQRLLRKLRALMPPLQAPLGSSLTFDPQRNSLIQNSYGQYLDYVLFSTQHLQPSRSSVETLRLKSSSEFPYCRSAPLQPIFVSHRSKTCRIVEKTRDLSDHFPVVGHFEF